MTPTRLRRKSLPCNFGRKVGSHTVPYQTPPPQCSTCLRAFAINYVYDETKTRIKILQVNAHETLLPRHTRVARQRTERRVISERVRRCCTVATEEATWAQYIGCRELHPRAHISRRTDGRLYATKSRASVADGARYTRNHANHPIIRPRLARHWLERARCGAVRANGARLALSEPAEKARRAFTNTELAHRRFWAIHALRACLGRRKIIDCDYSIPRAGSAE